MYRHEDNELHCPSGAVPRGGDAFFGLRPRSAGFTLPLVPQGPERPCFTSGDNPAPRWGEDVEPRLWSFPRGGVAERSEDGPAGGLARVNKFRPHLGREHGRGA
jgi:hypothetical protein